MKDCYTKVICPMCGQIQSILFTAYYFDLIGCSSCKHVNYLNEWEVYEKREENDSNKNEEKMLRRKHERVCREKIEKWWKNISDGTVVKIPYELLRAERLSIKAVFEITHGLPKGTIDKELNKTTKQTINE